MADDLKSLLTKGKELRIADLKNMLQGFDEQRKERARWRHNQKKEVSSLLNNFKEERIASNNGSSY